MRGPAMRLPPRLALSALARGPSCILGSGAATRKDWQTRNRRGFSDFNMQPLPDSDLEESSPWTSRNRSEPTRHIACKKAARNLVRDLLEHQNPSRQIILECNPGPGILTGALLKAGARVVAFESEKTFIPHLEPLQRNMDGELQVVHCDFFKMDPRYQEVVRPDVSSQAIFQNLGIKAVPWSAGVPIKVFGILPYKHERRILWKILFDLYSCESIYRYGRVELNMFVSEKEFRKLIATPKRPDLYQVLAVLWQVACDVKFLHMKKAWPDHRRECRCLKSCKPRYPPDSVRLLGRVIIKLMDEKPSESEKLYSFYDLESNISKLTEDKKEGLRQLAMTFQHFMREEIQDASQLPPSFDLFEAFAKVICNSFTICNAEMQEVGVGLYPSMSLLNHSCDPNCSIVFNGPHLLLRAVREIEAGEELTICYLDMLMTSEERRKQLRDQYCFECDCVRCQTQDKDADMLTGDEQIWKEVQESLKKIEELKAHWKWEQVLALCQAIINSNSDRLPDINIYQLKVLDCAMDACINLGMLEEALFYAMRTMEPYRIFFPGSHPVRGVQVMKVGKLQLHQGMFPQAMKNLRLAFDIMKVTHGREHSLIEDLILLLEECDANIRAS